MWSDLISNSMLASRRIAKVSPVHCSDEGVCQSQSDTDEGRVDMKSMYGARFIEGSDQASEWFCQSQCSYKGDEGPWSGQFLWKSILKVVKQL